MQRIKPFLGKDFNLLNWCDRYTSKNTVKYLGKKNFAGVI
ncbi:hypothetical protein Cylst_2768 [Cylindrospermum stagnale PCC 7417]|uniref:Uncharacterized protein n=1 Tax=Cylindrospermum stagnale PCC 7417 TaxID=56107 RepID=K9WX61_9NOST|nr:hypothetical protein Cylst_2768 [Cylindrospermum stagnale PCC 7417]